MSSAADWMVVAGFLLAALGVSLRIFMMMRSSDAHPLNSVPEGSRNLMRTYSATFPKSRLPLAMSISLTAGLVLLIAGFLLEFR
jgi:uncharacterized membrane protein